MHPEFALVLYYAGPSVQEVRHSLKLLAKLYPKMPLRVACEVTSLALGVHPADVLMVAEDMILEAAVAEAEALMFQIFAVDLLLSLLPPEQTAQQSSW